MVLCWTLLGTTQALAGAVMGSSRCYTGLHKVFLWALAGAVQCFPRCSGGLFQALLKALPRVMLGLLGAASGSQGVV